jgi:hypothetical protein
LDVRFRHRPTPCSVRSASQSAASSPQCAFLAVSAAAARPSLRMAPLNCQGHLLSTQLRSHHFRRLISLNVPIAGVEHAKLLSIPGQVNCVPSVNSATQLPRRNQFPLLGYIQWIFAYPRNRFSI